MGYKRENAKLLGVEGRTLNNSLPFCKRLSNHKAYIRNDVSCTLWHIERTGKGSTFLTNKFDILIRYFLLFC